MTGGPRDEASDAPLHLLKMAVGIADLDDLRQVRAARIAQLGGSFVRTRNHPRRAEAVLRGGSLYWVIRGRIQARQLLVGFHTERDEKGRPYCLIEVDPGLVPTASRTWRPFQGWRYLPPADAPPDLSPDSPPEIGTDPMPAAMLADLRTLGLL